MRTLHSVWRDSLIKIDVLCQPTTTLGNTNTTVGPCLDPDSNSTVKSHLWDNWEHLCTGYLMILRGIINNRIMHKN